MTNGDVLSAVSATTPQHLLHLGVVIVQTNDHWYSRFRECVCVQECLDRAAMVPAALNAVLYTFQPAATMTDMDLHPLCVDLLKLGASPIFLDAVYDATAVVVYMVG